MGCCLFALILTGMPRLAFLLWWLFQPNRFTATFDSFLIPLLGVIFAPWTALVYVMVAPGGVIWFDWLFLGFAIMLDIGSYASGGYSGKKKWEA